MWVSGGPLLPDQCLGCGLDPLAPRRDPLGHVAHTPGVATAGYGVGIDVPHRADVASQYVLGDAAGRHSTLRRITRQPPVSGIAVVASLTFGTLILLSTSGALGVDASQVVDDVAQLAAGLFATAACWWTWVRAQPPDRTWRLLLGIGMAGWSIGQVIWTWYQVVAGLEMPSPSLADVGYLALPLFALPALWLLPSRPRRVGAERTYRVVFALDSLVIVGSLLALTWVTALGAGVRQPHPTTSPLAFLVALSYPVTDFVLVVFVLLVASFRRARHPGALFVLGIGLVSMSISDSLFFFLISTGAESMPPLYNLGFVAGPALLAIGVLMPGGEPAAPDLDGAARRGLDDRIAVFLPYVPLGLVMVVVLGRYLAGAELDRVVVWLGVLLMVLVLVRQLFTVLENANLLRGIHDSQELLTRHAYHDSLTGLANRVLFREQLDKAVALHRDQRRPLALVFCDLDDFKLVNDRLGHACGDEVLRTVGNRLRTCTSPTDTVARLGGDEFAILLDHGGDSPNSVAELLLVALSRPIAVMVDPQTVPNETWPRSEVPGAWPAATRHGLSTTEVTIGSSLGLVVLDEGDEPVNADLLLARVDAAMYAAKRRGKNRFVTFQGDLPLKDLSPSLLGELRVLLTATKEGSTPPPEVGAIEVWYQPVVQIPDGALVSLEALVRWQHPRFGLLPAEVVVASAADTGMLDVLENLVLTTACRDVYELRSERGLGHVAVHVNVAAQRTCEVELLTTVRQELHRYGLPGEALVIELTESTRVPDLRAAVAVLSTLRGDGVRLALDDFGSGFSGLSYLMELPVDIVKLDRSLIVAAPGSRAAAIARAAALLTLGLGLELIAEGVETPEQTDGLIELGCRLGQGFRYARPKPMNDVRAWISAGA